MVFMPRLLISAKGVGGVQGVEALSTEEVSAVLDMLKRDQERLSRR